MIDSPGCSSRSAEGSHSGPAQAETQTQYFFCYILMFHCSAGCAVQPSSDIQTNGECVCPSGFGDPTSRQDASSGAIIAAVDLRLASA
jgi:hypothetical protein